MSFSVARNFLLFHFVGSKFVQSLKEISKCLINWLHVGALAYFLFKVSIFCRNKANCLDKFDGITLKEKKILDMKMFFFFLKIGLRYCQ